MKNNRILLLSLIFNCTTAIAQDTSKAIGLPAVLQLVGQNHPMVKYSALIPFKAGAELTIARGNFDPQFNYFRDQKYYDNTNYYELQQMGLQLNTLSPISINAGVEQANGTYLNPEEKTPSGGLYYSGVSVSLLRNALTDKRRTLLRQSKLIREQSFFEQQIVLNELGREIIGAYLDWVMAEKEKAIYTRAIASVEERLVAIRQEVIAGSKAEIDTLETYVLAENFRLYIREATLKVFKAKLALSAHLWLNDEQPLEIEENAKPDENSMFFIDSMLVNYSDKKWNEMLLLNHPELLELGFQKDIGNLEMKLKKQAILPDLKLKYQVLTPPGSTGTQVVYDNYKFGVNFNTSLFLRQERGAYLKSKYEFESISFKYTQKTREIQLKNRALWQQIETYTSNYTNFINITAGYEKLLTAEVLKTDAGESNLFIINTRQIRFLEAEVKLVQMWAKMQESKVDYLMQAGILYKTIPL